MSMAHFNYDYYNGNPSSCEVFRMTNLFGSSCAECFIRTAFSQIRYDGFPKSYSLRSASTGVITAALSAGATPKITPTTPAPRTTGTT